MSGVVLTETLEIILKLLHPAMPFVTEALWTRVHAAEAPLPPNPPSPQGGEGGSGGAGSVALLISQPWPQPTGGQVSDVKCQVFEFTRELVTAIRQIRNEDPTSPEATRGKGKIPPKQLLDVTLAPGNETERAWCADAEVQDLIRHFARVRSVSVGSAASPRAIVRATTIHVQPTS